MGKSKISSFIFKEMTLRKFHMSVILISTGQTESPPSWIYLSKRLDNIVYH